MTSFWCLFVNFEQISHYSVSIFDYKQLNPNWVLVTFHIFCKVFKKKHYWLTVSSFVSRLMHNSETVVRRCSVNKVFLEISQNSQENTCARDSFLESLEQVFSCEFCEISKNTSFYRTPPVAASNN